MVSGLAVNMLIDDRAVGLLFLGEGMRVDRCLAMLSDSFLVCDGALFGI
jgi:hypothetical protein